MEKKLKIFFRKAFPGLVVAIAMLPFLIFCIAKLSQLEEKINADFERLMSLVYNNGNIDDPYSYENHRINYTVKANGYNNPHLYRRPEDVNDEIIYTINSGDEVSVTNIVTCYYTNETYAKATVTRSSPRANYTGFIKLKSNPYKDGQFTETNSSYYGGGWYDVLSIKSQSVVVVNTTIRQDPYYSSRATDTTRGGVFTATAVSSDFQWVHITSGGENLGWIPKSDLTVSTTNEYYEPLRTPIDVIYDTINDW